MEVWDLDGNGSLKFRSLSSKLKGWDGPNLLIRSDFCAVNNVGDPSCNDQVLSARLVLTHGLLSTTLGWKECFQLHFTNEASKTKTLKPPSSLCRNGILVLVSRV